MSAASLELISEFWSWVNAILGLVLLGVLLPGMVALCLGMIPVALQRRDGRPFRGMVTATALFVAGGAFSLFNVHQGPPAWDFWLVLAFQIGVFVFVFATIALVRLGRRRAKEEREGLSALRASVSEALETRSDARPAIRARLRAIDAEYYVADWMRAAGASEARVTRERRDGGVDVRSVHYVAQVKHRPSDFVSVDLIRALNGVAAHEGRAPLFFASGRYSRDATDFARQVGMALFIFQPDRGRFVAANALAQGLMDHGLRRGELADSGQTVDA